MSAIDWDRTSGLSFLTVNDTGDSNVFGQNCLDLPFASSGTIFTKSATYNQIDGYLETRMYFKGSNLTATTMWGLRVNSSNLDGYYAGFEKPAGQTHFTLFKLVSNVLTVLKSFGRVDQLTVVDTEYDFRFQVKGDVLIAYLLELSGEVIAGVQVIDTTFTGVSGRMAIRKQNISTRQMRLDKLNLKQVS